MNIVKLLIDKGADVNAKTDDGMTALIVAAENGQADVAKLLIDKGADINVKNPETDSLNNLGFTPLMYAAFWGRMDIVKLLLDKGADLNAKDFKGNTAEKLARQYDHYDIAAVLKKAEAKQ